MAEKGAKRFPLAIEFDGNACYYDQCRNGLVATGGGQLGFIMLPEDIVQPLKVVPRESEAAK